MKLIDLLLCLIPAVFVHGQYSGSASVSQGRATKTVSPLYTCAGGRPTDQGNITATDGTQWTMPAKVRFTDPLVPFASDLYNGCSGALYANADAALAKLNGSDIIEVDPGGEVITAFIFADNYFELYVNGVPVGKDKVPFTQFNSSIVRFRVNRPFTISMLLVDWEENLGLGSEANGGFAFHPGDGGMVAVFKDEAGKIVAKTDRHWKAQTFYTSPILDLSCPKEINNERLSELCSTQNSNNGEAYYALHWSKPDLWNARDFNDNLWPDAYEYSNAEIGVNNKPAFTNFTDIFDDVAQNASFIWSSNVVLDNEVVVRYTVGLPSSAKNELDTTGLRIIPNPGGQSFHLEIENTSLAQRIIRIEILNPQGRILCSSTNDSSSFDTSNLTPGLYIIKIICQNQLICKQWIKQ